MMMRSSRAGRARIGDLVLYDVVLLGVVIGLLYAEQQLPSREELAARAAARANPPRPVVTEAPPAAERVAPAPTPTEPRPTPRPTEAAPAEVPDRDPAREQVQRLVIDARAVFEAGDPDGALDVLALADEALRASPAWAELAVPAIARVENDLAGKDAWRAVRPDVQVLADAAQVADLEALLEHAGAQTGELEAERGRAKGRAEKRPGGAGAGFQIRGFVPDEAKLDGRRCTVEGGVERKTLEHLRDAVDVVLALRADKLGADLGARLTLRVLQEDAPAEPATALRVTTHTRQGEPPGELIARARLVVARAVVGASAPKALPWAREALVHALAGTEPAGRATRPRFTPSGRTWRRRALATVTGARLLAAMKARVPDPSLVFALGVAALWGGVDDGPLARALDAARQGRDHALTPDEARALASALPSLLESS